MLRFQDYLKFAEEFDSKLLDAFLNNDFLGTQKKFDSSYMINKYLQTQEHLAQLELIRLYLILYFSVENETMKA